MVPINITMCNIHFQSNDNFTYEIEYECIMHEEWGVRNINLWQPRIVEIQKCNANQKWFPWILNIRISMAWWTPNGAHVVHFKILSLLIMSVNMSYVKIVSALNFHFQQRIKITRIWQWDWGCVIKTHFPNCLWKKKISQQNGNKSDGLKCRHKISLSLFVRRRN